MILIFADDFIGKNIDYIGLIVVIRSDHHRASEVI